MSSRSLLRLVDQVSEHGYSKKGTSRGLSSAGNAKLIAAFHEFSSAKLKESFSIGK